MTDRILPAPGRRAHLAELVARRGFVRVADAAHELGVSDVTVRSDLVVLHDAGAVRRVHGGAMSLSGGSREPTLEQSIEDHIDEKVAIAALAAARVRSGGSVLLDVGSTALAVAAAIVARTDLRDVLVVTSGLDIARALEPAIPRLEVLLTGGSLRARQHSLVGPGAMSTITALHTDLAIVGCNGVDPLAGITNLNLPEAEVKRAMLLAAETRIVVADGAKLGRVTLATVAALDDVHELITAGADAAVVGALRASGLRVSEAPHAAPPGYVGDAQ